jgi:hypothetical protein
VTVLKLKSVKQNAKQTLCNLLAKTKYFLKARHIKLMVIQQKDAAGAIYDHAGIRSSDTAFVANLNVEEGRAPRALDIAVERNRKEVEHEVLQIVEKVMTKLNKNMQVNHGN